jgi:hypothetical protein
MRMSEKRKQDIYDAVYEEIMKVRIGLSSRSRSRANVISWRELDLALSVLQDNAAKAAVDAAIKAFRR